MRDRLGEWMTDDLFASAFGDAGPPGGAAGAAGAGDGAADDGEPGATGRRLRRWRTRLDWKYALGLPLDDPGFDFSVLSEFRARVAAHGLEEAALDALLAKLAAEGLVRARRQAAHRFHARDRRGPGAARHRTGRARASAPRWRRWPPRPRTGSRRRFCTSDWTRRYGARVDSWRLPSGQRPSGTSSPSSTPGTGTPWSAPATRTAPPAWARELPAVQVLRTVLVQNFHRRPQDAQGREVIRRREPGLESGLPPARIKVASPYDPDARWARQERPAVAGLQAARHRDLRRPARLRLPPGPRRCPARPLRPRHPPEPDHPRRHHRRHRPRLRMTIPVSAALRARRGWPPPATTSTPATPSAAGRARPPPATTGSPWSPRSPPTTPGRPARTTATTGPRSPSTTTPAPSPAPRDTPAATGTRPSRTAGPPSPSSSPPPTAAPAPPAPSAPPPAAAAAA